ncbi:MAG: hypothetical protein II208_04705 [Alphaproteobacteria bacterium]|nr:hypothetical protein [Alphaproteobacteria bacterium]
MNLLKTFLFMGLCAMPCVAGANVATTAGSNLTAWNGNSGATNNNNWNQMMNSRNQATGVVGAKPKADFGNCNSLILRCAQPKCSGCTTMDIARTIVAGCVNSNDTCKKHGNDLVEFISAQIVSDANAKVQQEQIAAQNAAAQAAAAQSSAQLQQMQQQMQQMQYEMQQQNAQQMQQMQAALDEQKALAAAAQANAADAAAAQANAANQMAAAAAAAAQSASTVTDDLTKAANEGVSADILARNKISGQILTRIENAEVALKTLNATMQNIFTYAGCDRRGNNCSGPKRVKIFKQKAMGFFEPYDTIVDEAYEALEMALAVGVDVHDVIMMLNGACNQWGKFMCTSDSANKKHKEGHYTKDTCKNDRSVKGAIYDKDGNAVGSVRGGMECTIGMVVPPQDDSRCTVTELIGGPGDNEEVWREWLDEAYDGDKFIRVGCATSALETIAIFGRRSSRNEKTLDLDTLERIIAQDAPEFAINNKYMQTGNSDIDRFKYCAVTEKGYQRLLNAVKTRKLPKTVCTTDKALEREFATSGLIGYTSGWVEYGLAQQVGSIDTIEGCETYKNYALVEKGCSVEWSPETSKCLVKGDLCGFDVIDGSVKKKAPTPANKTTAADICLGVEYSCEYAKGKINEKAKSATECCLCGTKPFDPGSQKCEDGKLEKVK